MELLLVDRFVPRTDHSGGRIEIYQVLRYIAAVGILIYHCGVVGEHLYCGVDIFMVLSGYITMLSTEGLAAIWEHGRSSRQTMGNGAANHPAVYRFCVTLTFWVKRVIRILPLYYIATILMFAIVRAVPEMSVMTNAEGMELVKSLLCIPHINSKGNLIPVFGAGWTVDCEMSFYLVFGIAMMISMQYRGIIAAAIIVLLHLICNLYPSTLGHYYRNGIMLEFVWGIALYVLLHSVAIRRRIGSNGAVGREYDSAAHGWTWHMMTVIITVCVTHLVLDIGAGSNIIRSVRIGIPATVLVGALYVLLGNRHCSAWLVRGGDVSFSFYLIEYYVAASYKIIAAGQGYLIRWTLLMLAIILTTGLAHLSYHLIEIPCARAGRQLTREIMRRCS